MAHITDLIGIAKRVPEAKYILGHALGSDTIPRGGDHVPWADKYLDIIAEQFHEFPDNFWVEIRDFDSPDLKRALREVPATRLLAGTDSVTHVGPPFLPYGTIFGVKRIQCPHARYGIRPRIPRSVPG